MFSRTSPAWLDTKIEPIPCPAGNPGRKDVMTKLKQLTQAAGITQRELSERSGVPLRAVQDYTQGHKPINSAAALTVYKLAKALDTTVENLLEFD